VFFLSSRYSLHLTSPALIEAILAPIPVALNEHLF
jgi:hypothetical protein